MNWSKATASSANGFCVEVAHTDGQVLVRDTKWERDPDRTEPRPTLTVDPGDWEHTLTALTGGTGHVATPTLAVIHRVDGTARFHGNSAALEFTADEMTAFLDGVSKDEFAVATPAT